MSRFKMQAVFVNEIQCSKIYQMKSFLLLFNEIKLLRLILQYTHSHSCFCIVMLFMHTEKECCLINVHVISRFGFGRILEYNWAHSDTVHLTSKVKSFFLCFIIAQLIQIIYSSRHTYLCSFFYSKYNWGFNAENKWKLPS
jgi:hypothetical protein